jgi:hypothetical protein
METEQFNEMLSYLMVIALNSSTLVFQQSQQRRLTPEEIEFCQDDLLRTAHGIQQRLGMRTESPGLPKVPPFGRSDP